MLRDIEFDLILRELKGEAGGDGADSSAFVHIPTLSMPESFKQPSFETHGPDTYIITGQISETQISKEKLKDENYYIETLKRFTNETDDTIIPKEIYRHESPNGPIAIMSFLSSDVPKRASRRGYYIAIKGRYNKNGDEEEVEQTNLTLYDEFPPETQEIDTNTLYPNADKIIKVTDPVTNGTIYAVTLAQLGDKGWQA